MTVLKTNLLTYQKNFKCIANKLDPAVLFKVDIVNNDSLNHEYYIIPGRAAVTLNFIDNNTIEIKGLIANKAGSEILQYIIKKYAATYNIILDSFNSNDYFYTKNGFKVYDISIYNPVYDPDGLNINKEDVYFYYYDGPAAAVV